MTERMTVPELLARARGEMGHKTRSLPDGVGERAIYQLGGGALNPDATHSWGEAEDGGVDCSAYVCWCVRLSKYQPRFGWLNTDGIWLDARRPTGFFEQIARPEVGAVVVYPSAGTVRVHLGAKAAHGHPAIGHVGIVTMLDRDGRAAKVIHCSSGNYRRTGDAIQETDTTDFDKRAAAVLYAWAATVQRPREEEKEEPCTS